VSHVSADCEGITTADTPTAYRGNLNVNIVQLTPGAGAMYCGNCLRDNALVRALRGLGHQVLMVPLYLPLTLDEADQSAGTPVFFGGINVYLEQKSSFFRRAPGWLHRLLDSRPLLKWAASRSGSTQVESLGDVTLSMLNGESGHQARELDQLIEWLGQHEKPDVFFLSNALLIGMARRLKSDLGRPVVCMLQGEDYFLDSLSEPYRKQCWDTLASRAKDADLFLAPSHYFGDLMRKRLSLPPERVKIVYNGINLDGYPTQPAKREQHPPVIGYLARMCKEKGLDLLIDAFTILHKRGRLPGLRLRAAGSLGPSDQGFVESLRGKLRAAGLSEFAEFYPNIDRDAKVAFLQGLSVFSVPARYSEAFGLYVLEALAAGVPVVQPRAAAFPELIELAGGGVLFPAENPGALADALEPLLLDGKLAQAMGETGRLFVREHFSAESMAQNLLEALKEADSCLVG